MPTKVVYVHGLGGSPEDWRSVQSRQPGLALSLDKSAKTPAESALGLADDVAKLVGGSFALCGYSMGGRIAILAAQALLERKRKPDGVILISTGFGFASEEERQKRNQSDEEWATLAAGDSGEFWKKWYEQEIFASFQTLPESTREAWIEQRKSLDIEALTGQLRNLGPGRHQDLFPIVRNLRAKGVPVLYLAGELDKKYSELSNKAGEIQGVLVDRVPGAGHMLPLEAPEALAMRIARFIR
jgi:2-succinyl-6-hydroxy-2,4-cyclohexadiene-1-carboxylate synthase